MLALVKKALRITHKQLDDVIQSDIDACLLDLKRVGILRIDEEDALIKKLVELYTKGEEDYQGKGDRYRAAYEKMRDAVSMCGEYNDVQ